MNSCRTCFSFHLDFSRPAANKSPSLFSVLAVSEQKNLWRNCNSCCFVGPPATSFSFVFLMSYVSIFLLETSCLFFTWVFSLCVGTKSGCSIRRCQAKHNKNFKMRFLLRPDPILQALEKSCSFFLISL